MEIHKKVVFILISCAVPISLVCSGSLVILASAPGQNSDRGKGKLFPLQAINHRSRNSCLQYFHGQERGGTIGSGDGRFDSPGN